MTTPYSVCVPQENVNDDSVSILNFKVSQFEKVSLGQAIVEVESSKASFDLYAEREGYIYFTRSEGDSVDIGNELALIADSKEMLESYQKNQSKKDSDKANSKVRFSKKALALIEKHQLSKDLFSGTSMIKASHVEEVLEKGIPSPEIASTKVSRVKRAEIRSLRDAYERTLQSMVVTPIPALNFSEMAPEGVDAAGMALAVLIHECGRILKDYPLLRSNYCDGSIRIFDEINIGFAIDAGAGLKVPVIKRVDQKSLEEVALEKQELVVRYLNDDLKPDVFVDGAFTITDLSSYGSRTIWPLINGEQSSILAIGAPYQLSPASPFVQDASLAFDHQASSGKEASLFLNELASSIEEYSGKSEFDGAESAKVCCQCYRSPGLLKEIEGFLLKTSEAEEYICSVCLKGW